MRLAFDEDRHAYLIDGIQVPSVTQVLRAEGLYSDYGFATEVHRFRGTAVHNAAAEIDRGGDPWFTVPPTEPQEIQEACCDINHGYMPAYRRYKERSGFCGLLWECALICPRLRFGGKPDAFGLDSEGYTLLDIKSGECPPMVGAQLALYAYLLKHGVPVDKNHPGIKEVLEIVRSGKPFKRRAVRLQKDGTDTTFTASPKGRSYDDPYWDGVALSAVNLFNAKREHGIAA